MSDESVESADRFTVRVTAEAHFAWVRTRLAVENTLLAWVRTATSLIGFGFTIVQFFQRFHDMPNAKSPWLPNAPRYLGLALIFAGIVALTISTLQYRSINRYLRSGSFGQLAAGPKEQYQSATPVVALLLLAIGIFVFFAVIFQLV
jgi:putative membrane protein